jgi:glycosyltransferase involved in cell wall biosynthesis
MRSGYQNERSYAATVVIPTFNRMDLLRRSLDSLRDQKAGTEPFEIVICDDGSTDGTFDMLRSRYGDLNFKYAFYPDHGYHVSRARNLGIRLAEGDICIFLDAGNLAGSSFVSAHLEAHRNAGGKAAVIGYSYGNTAFTDLSAQLADYEDSDAATIIAHARVTPNLADIRQKLFDRCKGDISHLGSAWGLFWGGNISAPTQSARDVGGFDEWYTSWACEDIDFGLALKLSGHKFVFSRQAELLALPHRKDKGFREDSNAKNSAYLHGKYDNSDSARLIDHVYGDEMVKAELNDLERAG